MHNEWRLTVLVSGKCLVPMTSAVNHKAKGGGVSTRGWGCVIKGEETVVCSQFALVLWERQNTCGHLLLSCLEQCHHNYCCGQSGWKMEKIEWMDVVKDRVGGRWRGDGGYRMDGCRKGQSGWKLERTQWVR